MASPGNNQLNKGIPDIKDAFVVIVKTEWNAGIANELEKGCLRVLQQHGVAHTTIVVPGAFELPFAVRAYQLNAPMPASAFIVLGAVIKGDTPHFDYVCKGVTDGVVMLNQSLDVPTIFGVLTVNDEKQATERIGGLHGHKGEEAAITAIKMIALNRRLYKHLS